jgi:hypothetical protein
LDVLKKLWLGVFLAILILPMVFALNVPSQTRTIGTGCEILTPDFTELKQSTDFNFYFHVYNATAFVDDNLANCTFHLYSSQDNGLHILMNADVPFLPPRDFKVFVNGSTNLSAAGRYSYLFECGVPVEHAKSGQSDACGIEGEFSVTPIGSELSIEKSIVYLIIFLLSLLIFAGLMTMGIALPSNNKSDEMTGYIIAVSNMKYLKMIFLGFAYMFAVFISYFAWMLCYSYLDFSFLSSIMQWVFYVLAILTLPLFILFAYLCIANLVRDSKIHEKLMLGFKVKEGDRI